jgi:hypothetical protein
MRFILISNTNADVWVDTATLSASGFKTAIDACRAFDTLLCEPDLSYTISTASPADCRRGYHVYRVGNAGTTAEAIDSGYRWVGFVCTTNPHLLPESMRHVHGVWGGSRR